MKFIATITTMIIFVGCSMIIKEMPQSATEFKAAVTKGAFMVKSFSVEVNMPFAQAYNKISRRGIACFNVTKTSSTPYRSTTGAMYGPVLSSVSYNSSVRRLSKTSGQLVIQLGSKATFGPKMPRGGFYKVVVDVIKSGKYKTRLNFYGPKIGFKKVYVAIKAWGKGQQKKCPKFTGYGGKYRYHNK